MKKFIKKFLTATVTAILAITTAVSAISCGGNDTVKIGIPDDATNGARAIKLLEKAGLIEVDPSVGYSPELKDITKYLYNIEIVPTAANSLTSVLPDYGACTINGTYATSAGLVPSKDALLIEQQDESGENPYVNIIVARTADKDRAEFKTIVETFQTAYVAVYMLAKYQEAYFPAFNYEVGDLVADEVKAEVDNYKANVYPSAKGDKTVIKVGVCGVQNDYWYAVQKLLDDQNANIYIELITFDAYNLPNEALNNGDVDLNSFQHKAYLAKEIAAANYTIETIGDTLIAPLSLYSNKADSIDALKNLAGKKE